MGYFPTTQQTKRRFSIATLFVVFLVGGLLGYGVTNRQFVSDYSYQASRAAAEASGAVINQEERPGYLGDDVDFSLFWDVWQLVRDRYVDETIFDTELFYGAMQGLVAGVGDPHTQFFPPDVTERFQRQLSGAFEGVGMEIGIKNKQLLVIAPLDGTPAFRAGLRAKDAIVAIDGYDTSGISIEDAVNRIMGPKGTEVVLSIYREGYTEPRDVSITRARITIPSARFEMRDDIAYIRLTHFNADTTTKFRAAVRQAQLANPRGLVVDLRNNSGGFLEVAVDITSAWIDNDIVVRERFRNGGSEREYLSRGTPNLKDMPTVILVNGGSASASEILAGALQDYDLATIIGVQTFGKGSVQELEPLPDGSSVKITVARWFTPSGNSIDDEGVTPDIIIELTDEDYDNDRDPQLDMALEHVRSGL
jgi:carboxyl-terminal processing protease